MDTIKVKSKNPGHKCYQIKQKQGIKARITRTNHWHYTVKDKGENSSKNKPCLYKGLC